MKLSLGPVRAALARARAWPFTRHAARAALATTVLVVLVVVGRATFAGGAGAVHGASEASTATATPSAEPAASSPPPVASATPVLTVTAAPPPEEPDPPAPLPASHGPATPDDPVVLNDATVDDLQRLPGVGQKRALAILELRTRLGRFHQIEDLLKVRGIGLKTLRRLRPLLRLDRPPPAPDAGVG